MKIRRFAISIMVLLGIGCAPALAEIKVDCDYTKGKKIAFCITKDEGGEQHLWKCDKKKDATWACDEISIEHTSASDEPALKSAATNAAMRAKKPSEKR